MAENRVTGLLVWHIISGVFEQAAVAVVVLWGLPQIGINIPIWALVSVMVAMAAYAVFSHGKAVRALKTKPMAGLPDMVGTQGEVASALAPEGLVKIRGELWAAEAASGRIMAGQPVTVVKQDGLKLTVRLSDGGQPDGAA